MPTSERGTTYPGIPQGEARPLQNTILAVEGLGFTREPINATFYAENDATLHALVRTDDNPDRLLGVFTLQLKKMIPAKQYTVLQPGSSVNLNDAVPPATIPTPQTEEDSPITEPTSVSFKEAEEHLREKGCQKFPIGALFYRGDDGRIHAFVSADEAPDSLIGVFKLKFNKIITPERYFAFSPNLQRELITANSPYDDGRHP